MTAYEEVIRRLSRLEAGWRTRSAAGESEAGQRRAEVKKWRKAAAHFRKTADCLDEAARLLRSEYLTDFESATNPSQYVAPAQSLRETADMLDALAKRLCRRRSRPELLVAELLLRLRASHGRKSTLYADGEAVLDLVRILGDAVAPETAVNYLREAIKRQKAAARQ
ncbi:MAG: hypothetical protein U1E63_07180 [Burkholderiales bacterium]